MTAKVDGNPEGQDRNGLGATEPAGDVVERVICWLEGLATLDLAEIVADGGITAGMVVQQEARKVMIPRLRAAIATLTPSNPVASGEAWIVGDASGSRWRGWIDGNVCWTFDRDKATRYARREDAENVHHEDEDAWSVQPYRSTPTPDPVGKIVARAPEEVGEAAKLIRYYKQRGYDDLGCGEVEKLLLVANRLVDELIEYEQALTDAEAARVAAFDRWREAEARIDTFLERGDWRDTPSDQGWSACNKCGESYPSAPAGWVHKCGKCSGYCKPVPADPRSPEGSAAHD